MATLKNTSVNDTGFLQNPNGTTAQRPGSPVAGMQRYNSSLGYIEWYDPNGATWRPIYQMPSVNLDYLVIGGGGGGGGGFAPAPAPTPTVIVITETVTAVAAVEERVLTLEGTSERDGYRLKWTGTKEKITLKIVGSDKSTKTITSDKIEAGEVLNDLLPGIAYSITAIPTESTQIKSSQTIAYGLPPLAPVQLQTVASSAKSLTVAWKQPSAASSYEITVTVPTGETFTITSTDPNVQIDSSQWKNLTVSIRAVGALNLKSTVSTIAWQATPTFATAQYQLETTKTGTRITWSLLSGRSAPSYRVVVDGKVACETSANECSAPAFYGAKSAVLVQTLGSSSFDEIQAKYLELKVERRVGKIYFAANSSKLNAAAIAAIKKAAIYLKSAGFVKITITGHVDREKGAPLKKTSPLSKERADQVAAVIKKILPYMKITTVGKGNATPDKPGVYTSSKNRRVEFFTK